MRHSITRLSRSNSGSATGVLAVIGADRTLREKMLLTDRENHENTTQ
jgi:hypothetical protein